MRPQKSLFISKPAARQRFDRLCQEKNEAMPFTAVTRTVERDGSVFTQTYHRRKKAISDGAQQTGKALIQSYAYQFARLVKTLPAAILNEEGHPSLKTNNVKLAKFRGNVTDRTVRNHLKELRNIGMITAYKYHGSKSNFELWIDPQILFNQPQMPTIIDFNTTDISETTNITSVKPLRQETDAKNSTLKGENGNNNDTNFPHRQSSFHRNFIETKNTTTSKKENSPIWKQNNGNKPNVNSPQGPERPCSVKMETKIGGGRNVDNSPKVWINQLDRWKTPGVAHEFRKLPRNYQHYIIEFWNHAKDLLWPSLDLLPQQKFAAFDSITVGVYQRLLSTQPNETTMNAYQKVFIKALEKASKYYYSHPQYYPGHPYAKFKEGTGYFDQGNAKGFKVALRWVQADKQAQHERYGEKVLDRAIKHLRNFQSGKLPKKFQPMSSIELFRYYETTIKAKFSNELLKDFYLQASKISYLRA